MRIIYEIVALVKSYFHFMSKSLKILLICDVCMNFVKKGQNNVAENIFNIFTKKVLTIRKKNVK